MFLSKGQSHVQGHLGSESPPDIHLSRKKVRNLPAPPPPFQKFLFLIF